MDLLNGVKFRTKLLRASGIRKDCPTLNPDCIEQSKMFKLECVTSKYRGCISVPYSRLFPWKLIENGKVKACFVFYGKNRSEPYPSKLVAESFEVDQREYERIAEIFRRFEEHPDQFMIEDWQLPTKKNFRRNDEFRKFRPLPQPCVDVKSPNHVEISFRGLYPCNVFLGSDEPVLVKEIIRHANKNGFWVSAKAVHYIIRSWMDDYKSGDVDMISKIRIGSICGHNPLWVTIERDPSIRQDNRWAV